MHAEVPEHLAVHAEVPEHLAVRAEVPVVPAPARARVSTRRMQVPTFEEGGPLFVENADRATAAALRAYNAGLGWNYGIYSGFKRVRA